MASTNLTKINPLASLLATDEIKDLLLRCDDPLDLKVEERRLIKKKYHDWCKINHPDKTENKIGENFFIYKEFGDAFLKFQEEKNENVWTYMCYVMVTFNNVDFENLSLGDIFSNFLIYRMLPIFFENVSDPFTFSELISEPHNLL